MKDPADAAIALLNSREYTEKLFADFIKDWAAIQKEQAALEKAGVGATEAVTLVKKLQGRYDKLREELDQFSDALFVTIRLNSRP
jgi:hypothetical protein